MKKHYRQGNDCLNCGTDLQGKFCHNCGQENLEMKESFGHMITHAVSDYFHFDDQFFHTLNPLLFKPGKLTNEYLAGRRAQYLHPVKMYIFISLVFFLLFFQNKKHNILTVRDSKQNESVLSDSLKKAVKKDINNDKHLTPQQKDAISEKLTTKNDSSNNTAAKKVKKKSDGDGNFTVFGSNANEKTYEEYLANQSKLAPGERDNFIERYFVKKGYDWKNQGKNATEIFIEGFKHNIPKMMFLLLPLFALILKIAFWKNRKLYVEHLIYSIHLHCFLFLFLTVVLIISMILPASWDTVMDWVGIAAYIIILWYVYRSFRTVYNRSRWRTVSKLIGVSLMYLFVFCVCSLILVGITALTSI
ncbi:DUF3667 domain-containing protein [Mucilaginibacter sp. 14171R-50]|uniref:DUF3667 domain-containing protein n=1 Tax=Mucilaginibacter sp. 14171R-50 TaxID=2703789 RepID=UPI00138D3134|nr:DUF3667 domain-containing protein [Mucilaginibacter sp. 14171R-50]QHS57272.1 DUF3667 domain-containing protein [Mucilaginibacter sp. 14171R-50]